jgi:pyruvate/2-oxoglutarate dehydrogenase complex dihydrolipoamide dehydrogenase (E3) component
VRLEPDEAHNRRLVELVHPTGWKNPEGQGRYNLLVVGGGTAGLVSAAGAAGLGARVALVERHLLGGDCLNQGCVPSKALLASARMAHAARSGEPWGVRVGGPVEVDFPAVMERMRRLRADIAPADSAPRFQGLGVDVFLGQARFVAPDAVEVDGQRLTFTRAVVASGGRPADPGVPGLKEAGYFTSDSVWSLTRLPRRLAVVGGGPIGCELAQAFRRFGADVTVLCRGAQVLPLDDAEAAAVVAQALSSEGVRLEVGVSVTRAEKRGEATVLHVTRGEASFEVEADAVLVAAGRAANVEGLGLEEAGVAYDASGVQVDDRLRTSNPRIFAAGDVASRFRFTHAADALARIAIQNALFAGRKKASALVIPWCTYTDPELAHVGLTAKEAAARGEEVLTLTAPLHDNDRARVDGETHGFARVHVEKKGGKLLGATVVGPHAGELIGEMALALTAGLTIGQVGATIHCYPTRAEAWKRLGDAYNRTRLTPRVKGLFTRYLGWRR